MPTFTVIDLDDAPPFEMQLPCEVCGVAVTRTARQQARILSNPRSRGAVFCTRRCHGSFMGQKNARHAD